MEALLDSDPAYRFFPFAAPRDLAALQLVSRRASAVLCREQPWECWINDSNLVVRAELHPTYARLHISPHHVLCLNAPADGQNRHRGLVLAFMDFPRPPPARKPLDVPKEDPPSTGT